MNSSPYIVYKEGCPNPAQETSETIGLYTFIELLIVRGGGRMAKFLMILGVILAGVRLAVIVSARFSLNPEPPHTRPGRFLFSLTIHASSRTG